MPVVKSAAMFIPVTVYNLAKEKSDGVPYLTERPQAEKSPSVHNFNPAQPEAIPNIPTFQAREDTPWPNTIPASMNLFENRADCPIPPLQTPSVKVEKAEDPPRVAAIPHAMVLPKQIEEKCTGGPHCPICKKEEQEGTEDRNSNRQKDQPRNHYPLNLQHPQSYDVPDRYSEQIRLRRDWDGKMECLNAKSNIDNYSSLESKSDYELEHKYETLI